MSDIRQYLVFTVFLLLLGTGCEPIKYVYVVQRDTPTNPIFTVIRMEATSSNTKLASDSEMALIKLGLSVVNPPIVKSVTTERGDVDSASMQESESGKNSAKGASKGKQSVGGIKEEYDVFDETNANYVIQVNARHNIFKIIEKDTREILTVGNSDIFRQDYGPLAATEENQTSILNEYKIYDLFTALGFKVNKPKAERPVKKTSS